MSTTTSVLNVFSTAEGKIAAKGKGAVFGDFLSVVDSLTVEQEPGSEKIIVNANGSALLPPVDASVGPSLIPNTWSLVTQINRNSNEFVSEITYTPEGKGSTTVTTNANITSLVSASPAACSSTKDCDACPNGAPAICNNGRCECPGIRGESVQVDAEYSTSATCGSGGLRCCPGNVCGIELACCNGTCVLADAPCIPTTPKATPSVTKKSVILNLLAGSEPNKSQWKTTFAGVSPAVEDVSDLLYESVPDSDVPSELAAYTVDSSKTDVPSELAAYTVDSSKTEVPTALVASIASIVGIANEVKKVTKDNIEIDALKSAVNIAVISTPYVSPQIDQSCIEDPCKSGCANCPCYCDNKNTNPDCISSCDPNNIKSTNCDCL